MADALCSECIDDRFLKEIVRSEGTTGHCDSCEQNRPWTITIDRLGQLLAPLISKHFRQGDLIPRFFENDEHDHWEQEGDDLGYVVQEVLGQSFEFEEQIIDAVVASEHCNEREGEAPLFERAANYVEAVAYGYQLRYQWLYAENELRRAHRFFSPVAKNFFDEIFHDVDGMLSADGSPGDRGVVKEIQSGFVAHRGRLVSGKNLDAVFLDPFKEVGPPPPERSRAGRMNAEGISIFYGSTDAETCLAELRPSIGEQAAVIAVQTTKPLRMLDFTRMRTAYRTLSYFQPDFEEQIEKFSFLRELGTLISRPVVPGHESEYLITQTMTEYLAHVHQNPFDGVIFDSAQRNGGKNVVVFPRMERDEPVYPLGYIQNSLAILETTSVRYEHRENKYRFDGETVEAEWDLSDLILDTRPAVSIRRAGRKTSQS